ncbi:MFS transporter [Nonomuraea cypriaca]|nr:MFS transporter [Nonomuraea cypriaca]
MAPSVGGMFGFYLLVSVVPSYAATAGAGGLGAGLATGAMMLSTVLLELAVPYLLARLGYRRVVALGLVLLGAPALALPLSPTLGLVLAVCLLRGAGLGVLVVVGTALVADLVPAERRGEGLGVYGVAVGVPSVIGLPLGLWAAERFGHSPVFLVAGILPLLSLLTLAVVPTTRPVRADVGFARLGNLTAPIMIFATVTVATGVVVTFLPVAGDAGHASLALLAQSITTPLARWWAGRSSDRYGSRRLLLPALILTATGIALQVRLDSPVAVIIGMALFGIGFGIAQNVTLTLMFDRVPREQFGRASMLWNLAFDAGMGIGAVGFGLLAAYTGYPFGFAIVAALLLGTLPNARRDLRGHADSGDTHAASL